MSSDLDVDPGETHKPDGHQGGDDKCDTQPFQRFGNVGILQFFPDGRHAHDSQQPSYTGTESVGGSHAHIGKLALLHEERTAQDGAVHGNQRQEDTQRCVKRGAEPLHDHFDQLYERCDYGDKDEQAEDAQVDCRKLWTQPRQGTSLQHVVFEHIVDGKGEHQNEGYCSPQPKSGFYVFRHSKIGAHTQEVCEYHVVYKYRSYNQTNSIHVYFFLFYYSTLIFLVGSFLQLPVS